MGSLIQEDIIRQQLKNFAKDNFFNISEDKSKIVFFDLKRESSKNFVFDIIENIMRFNLKNNKQFNQDKIIKKYLITTDIEKISIEFFF